MQLCPGFARQRSLETARAAPIPPPITLIIPIAPVIPVIPIIPIIPIILIILIILIAPITLIKIFAVLYCGMIAFWVSEGRFWQKKPRKKVRKNLAVDEKGRTFALAFRK